MMTNRAAVPSLLAALAVLALWSTPVRAAPSFQKTLGPVAPGAVAAAGVIQVPYLLWGGDVAAFHANGGLTTQKGSIFDKHGLKLKLVPGDDIKAQARDFISGKSPFLRSTMGMAAIVSEALGSDAKTRPYVVLQMTWSAGDHMVGREGIKRTAHLKGRKVALQEFGPHVDMLNDILKSAALGWNDIQVVWTRDITGKNGPAEAFRKDPSIAACFVITPDMIGLTGGMEAKGSGAEGTVKGAHVAVSTAQMSRSIADVYLVRKDFHDANPKLVEAFAAGYLEGAEKVGELRAKFEAGGSPEYMKLLKMVQDIYGKESIPTLEADAHGLILDCQYVGQPGNVAFFHEKGNLQNFSRFNAAGLEFARANGYIQKKVDLLPSPLDFNAAVFANNLKNVATAQKIASRREEKGKFKVEAVREEVEKLASGNILDDRTLVSFTIDFEANQTDFQPAKYRKDFQRVLETATKFGNAALVIEGHSDPTLTLATLVKAGMEKGLIRRTGSSGDYKYYYQGKELNMADTRGLIKEIERGAFDGSAENNPRSILTAAKNLSLSRSREVLKSIRDYAKAEGISFDLTQLQPVGMGIQDPIIPRPKTPAESAVNRRVEFKVVQVSVEALTSDQYDF